MIDDTAVTTEESFGLGMQAPAKSGRVTRAVTVFNRYNTRKLASASLVIAFIISRIAYALAGVQLRVNFGGDHYYWQVLDVSVLRHHFLQSLFYLHIEPPLFNFELGLLGYLPHGAIAPVTVVGDLVMGLLFALCVFWLMVELRVPTSVAFGAALLVEISPATILYENWQFYTYPTTVLLMLAALSCIKFWRTAAPRWGFLLFASCASIVLFNSTFQWPWMIAVLVPIVIAFRHRMKLVLVVGLLPVLLVAGWYAKNAVLFGTYSTSSLLGMNLARTTLLTADPRTLQSLVASGVLAPIALKQPFLALNAYEPLKGHRPHTGVRALDEVRKVDQEGANLNNRAEIGISEQFLENDIAFIKADPASYLHSVGSAVRLWFVPTDQYYWLDLNRSAIGPWSSFFDSVVGLEPEAATPTLSMAQLSYSAVLVYLILLLGAPVVIYRRRRDRAFSGTMLFMWLTVIYTFVVTSLVEFGENNRFRFELGALPLILAIVTVVEIGRVLVKRRRDKRLMRRSEPMTVVPTCSD